MKGFQMLMVLAVVVASMAFASDADAGCRSRSRLMRGRPIRNAAIVVSAPVRWLFR